MADSTLPDVPRLRLLFEVSRQGSIAGAARVVGISPSAVSQQLSVLERETGVRLLDRGPRGVVLTGAGEALAERAEAVLHLLEETRTAMERLSGDLAGRVRIGSIASAAASIVLPAAERLRGSYAEIELAISVLEPTASIEELFDATIDIAVIDQYDHVPMVLPNNLHVVEILTEPLVLIAPTDLPIAPGQALLNLKSADWVMPPVSTACGQAVRYACRALGFEPRVRCETEDLFLLVDAVSRGQGVALLPRMAVAAEVAPVSMYELGDPVLTRRILTATRRSNATRPIVSAVLEQLHRAP